MTKTRATEYNVTGIRRAPESAHAMVAGTVEFRPTSSATPADRAHVRARYARESYRMDAMPSGPAYDDEEAAAFLDKLGARLAFERSAVRAYEALLTKLAASDSGDGSVAEVDSSVVQTIREQEREHYQMLVDVIEQLGGDPTAITPSANVVGVIGKGVFAVLGDPRTTPAQCLEAILATELVDHEGWEWLTEVAQSQGHHALASRFRAAQRTEQRHLMQVRRWVAAAHDLED